MTGPTSIDIPGGHLPQNRHRDNDLNSKFRWLHEWDKSYLATLVDHRNVSSNTSAVDASDATNTPQDSSTSNRSSEFSLPLPTVFSSGSLNSPFTHMARLAAPGISSNSPLALVQHNEPISRESPTIALETRRNLGSQRLSQIRAACLGWQAAFNEHSQMRVYVDNRSVNIWLRIPSLLPQDQEAMVRQLRKVLNQFGLSLVGLSINGEQILDSTMVHAAEQTLVLNQDRINTLI